MNNGMIGRGVGAARAPQANRTGQLPGRPIGGPPAMGRLPGPPAPPSVPSPAVGRPSPFMPGQALPQATQNNPQLTNVLAAPQAGQFMPGQLPNRAAAMGTPAMGRMRGAASPSGPAGRPGPPGAGANGPMSQEELQAMVAALRANGGM